MKYIWRMQIAFRYGFLPVMLLLLGLTSCKDKLELNAPYKEIPSVYAVLNVEDPIHIIRVNKVFLGEGNANQMAQVADSINYPEGELNVSLNNSNGTNIVFRDSLVKTEEGTFNSTQRVYVSNAKLNSGELYTLSIKNLRTGNEFKASARAIKPVNPFGNHPFVPLYYPVPPTTPVNSTNYIDYSNVNVTYSIRFDTNEARLYQVLIRLHYYDSLNNSTNTIPRYIDYQSNNFQITDLRSFGSIKRISFDFKGAELFSAIGVGMSKVTNPVAFIGRKMYKIQFFIYSSSQDYLDYLEYSKPSLNIAQTKPIYSNFEANKAIGIFTFRTTVSVEKNMATQFISAFATNPSTCQYKFFNAARQLPGCQP